MQTRVRVLSWLGALAVAVSCPGCGEAHSCTAVGCTSDVTWSGDIPRSSEPEITLRIEFCKEGQCRSSIQVFSTTTGAAGHPTGNLNGSCSAKLNETTLSLSCSFRYPTHDLAQGDVFSLTLVDEDTGDTLVQKSGPVTLAVSQPNGPDCGPTCLNGSLSD